MLACEDTIAAIATPPGFGGIGIVRLSGPLVRSIAVNLLGVLPQPRFATFRPFRQAEGEFIDAGLALFFPAPHSFTGEDVLELHGHGGPVVMDMLLRRTLESGARLARSGEFSERAFLNGKLDLTQAEAIADLIESSTEAAARLANRTLQGELSRRVHTLVTAITQLRMRVEATIDFPEEDIDFFADAQIRIDLRDLVFQLREVITSAHQGQLVREGMQLVIAGPPNAGKSSLLNALSGSDSAIVTAFPGTTRDLLRENIQIDGMPLHIIDTAGLRHSANPAEQEGIRRAQAQMNQADRVLWVFDDHTDPANSAFDPGKLPTSVPLTFVRNKIDLTATEAGLRAHENGTIEVALSAQTGAGIETLKNHLKRIIGFDRSTQGVFIARRRHLDALRRARNQVESALAIHTDTASIELLAEDLRQAQNTLGEITGEVSSDELLGRIFSSFCIGK